MKKTPPKPGKTKVVALAESAVSTDAGARKLGMYVVRSGVRKLNPGWYVPLWFDGAEGTIKAVMRTLNRVNDTLESQLGEGIIVTLDPGIDD